MTTQPCESVHRCVHTQVLTHGMNTSTHVREQSYFSSMNTGHARPRGLLQVCACAHVPSHRQNGATCTNTPVCYKSTRRESGERGVHGRGGLTKPGWAAGT